MMAAGAAMFNTMTPGAAQKETGISAMMTINSRNQKAQTVARLLEKGHEQIEIERYKTMLWEQKNKPPPFGQT